MLKIFLAYKNYPYKVPLRVKFFNAIRYFFTFSFLEHILIANLQQGKLDWRRYIPPFYFYRHGTIRKAIRDEIRYSLDLSCLIDHSIFFNTINEPAFDNFMKILRPDSVVIDVGANIGFLSLQAARYCKNGFVFSFEPDSDTFRNLEKNIAENSYVNIKLFKKALGNEPGQLNLYKLEKNNPGANRILLHGNMPENENHEIVEVCTLDEFINEFPSVDVLKIDVEGFEINVLRGAEYVIRKWKPILFVELAEVNQKQQGYSARQLVEFIEGLKYTVRDARTLQSLDKYKTDYHTDIVCVYDGDN